MLDTEPHSKDKRRAKIGVGFPGKGRRDGRGGHALEDRVGAWLTPNSLRGCAHLREGVRQQNDGCRCRVHESPAGWVGEVQNGSLQHSLSVCALL